MNKLKYYCLRYQPYLLGVAFFLAIFLVWAIGRALGFASLHSLLAGSACFCCCRRAMYCCCTAVGQHHNLEGLLRDDADQAVLSAAPADREEVSLLRERLLQASSACTATSRAVPRTRMHCMPCPGTWSWPAGRQEHDDPAVGPELPYAEREGVRVAGLGGTRNCDWFFSSEAVLLDTAGRYMNSPEEAGKWRGFLQLLRQHRQRRPLNGLIVSVSIADILHGSVEDQERVAKRLRERIQESCALLEVRLPIYLVFTKCDLIPGFTAFYRQLDDAARGEVMGKTFSHKGYEQADWGQRFSNAMDG
jgi:type VI secretion system protein ImpL